MHGSTGGVWKRGKAGIMRHRQTKGPGTDRLDLNHRATSRLYRRNLTQTGEIEMRCLAMATFFLSAASGGVGLADAFTDAMEGLSQQNEQEVGRDAMVAAYERLLRDYPEHPDRAKAMLQLQSLWQRSNPRLGIKPDEEKQNDWVRRAYEAAPSGSETWFEAGFRHASVLTRKDPEEAKKLLQRLYEQAPDAVYQTKALWHLQGVARSQRDLAEAERICLILQHWTRDKKGLPKEMLRKEDVFAWIQESASDMMMQYAELPEPKAKRIARINDFVEHHVSVGVKVSDRNRDRIFAYLDKIPEFIPGLDGEKNDPWVRARQR
jgi:hypothetical protein